MIMVSRVRARSFLTEVKKGADTRLRTLILVAPLTDFSKELAIVFFFPCVGGSIGR